MLPETEGVLLWPWLLSQIWANNSRSGILINMSSRWADTRHPCGGCV